MIIIHQRNDHDNYPYYGIHKQQRMNHFGIPSFVRSPYRLPSRHHSRFHDAYADHPMYSPYHYHRSHPLFYPSPMDELGAALAEGMMAPSVAPIYRYQRRNYVPEPAVPVMFLYRHKDDQKANAATNGVAKVTAAAASDHKSPLEPKSKPTTDVKEKNRKENTPNTATIKPSIQAGQPATTDKNGEQAETSDGSKPSATVTKTPEENSENKKGSSSEDTTAQVLDKPKDMFNTNEGYIDPVELLLNMFNESGIGRRKKKDNQVQSQRSTDAVRSQTSPTDSSNMKSIKDKVVTKTNESYTDPVELLLKMFHEPDTSRILPNSNQADSRNVQNKPPTGNAIDASADTNAKVNKYREDITINIDVTGYNPAGLSVRYENGMLVVSGDQTNTGGFHTSFMRRVPLDEHRVDVDGMSAKLSDGLLSICVPRRRRESEPRSIKIVSYSENKKVADGGLSLDSSASQSDDAVIDAVADGDSSEDSPDGKAANTSKDEGVNDAKDAGKTIKAADVTKAENDDKAIHFEIKKDEKKEEDKNGHQAPSQTVDADQEESRSVVSSVSNVSCSQKSSVSVKTVSSDDEDDEGEETFEVV